jgi:membrane associated rhomboid family serine protease
MMMTPMVLRLLIVNAVLSIVFMILRTTSPELAATISHLVLLTPSEAILQGRVWQVATYMWFHEQPFQLLMSLLILWFFGPQFEQRWGPKSFLRFFVLAGIGSGVIAALVGVVVPFFNVDNSGMGAALNGLLMAFALAFPEATVRMYFIIPVTARQLVYVVILIEVVFAAAGSNHQLPAQLGGLLSGYLLVTGRWRPSRWGFGGGPKTKPRRPNPGNLRVIKGDKDNDDKDDDRPPKYLN